MSERAREDQRLTRRIESLFESHQARYGSPRIHLSLRSEGIRVGGKRVARLMRDAGLTARCSRIYRRSPGTTRFFGTRTCGWAASRRRPRTSSGWRI